MNKYETTWSFGGQCGLPERLLKEPLPGGLAKWKVHPLEEMLKVYYKNKKRGYDENGHPTEEKLKEFGLGLGLGYNPFFFIKLNKHITRCYSHKLVYVER